MWQQITTISEIDTVKAGTLLSKENPDDSVEEGNVYRVDGITDDLVSLHPESGSINEDVSLKTDQLFTQGWWMLKAN